MTSRQPSKARKHGRSSPTSDAHPDTRMNQKASISSQTFRDWPTINKWRGFYFGLFLRHLFIIWCHLQDIIHAANLF